MALKRGTNKPLKILANEICPELLEAQAKGNTVHLYNKHDALGTYDVIFGPKCWRIVEGLEKLVSVSLTAARNVKYTKKKKDDEDE